MQKSHDYASFRISTGGLIYRLLIALRIQEPQSYSNKRRLAFLMTLSWLPLFLLATFEGNLVNSNLDLPFIYDLKPYVRYLLIIPLLIAADYLIDPLIASNLQSISSSGILGDDPREKYQKAVDRLTQRKDSNLADIVILVTIVFITLSFMANLENLDISTDFTNWITIHGDSDARLTLAGWWFLVISSPVLQIILFRWFWRFLIWGEFLFQVSRIKLKLQPTHPDRAGGLGIIKNGVGAFILVFFAFGSMFSVALAEEILYTDFTFAQARPIVITYIITTIILMTLPQLFFSRQLMQAKRWGRVVYGGLGYKLSRSFDKKWGDPSDQTSGNELLKTADSSAVCDYADIFEVVQEMRYLPISLKDYVKQALFLLIPFVPLTLTEISASEIFSRIMDTLI